MIDKTVIPAAIPYKGQAVKGDSMNIHTIKDMMSDHVVHVFKCACGKVKTERH